MIEESIYLFPSSALRDVPRQAIDSINQLSSLFFRDEIVFHVHAGEWQADFFRVAGVLLQDGGDIVSRVDSIAIGAENVTFLRLEMKNVHSRSARESSFAAHPVV